jgi:hypothetical protein
MRALLEIGYDGYVAQEFIPTWPDKALALRHAAKFATCEQNQALPGQHRVFNNPRADPVRRFDEMKRVGFVVPVASRPDLTANLRRNLHFSQCLQGSLRPDGFLTPSMTVPYRI